MPVRSAVAVGLLVVALLSIAAPCGALAAQARPETLWQADPLAQGGSPVAASTSGGSSGTTTVMTASDSRWDARSAPVMVLLVGAGALLGVIVGLLPALVVSRLLGIAPRRVRRPRWRTRAEDVLVEPPRLPRPEPMPVPVPVPEPLALAAAPEPPGVAGRSPRSPVTASSEAAAGPADIAEARGRHKGLYDAEYAKQLHRLGSLREAISSERSAAAGQRSRHPAGLRRDGGPPPHPPQD